MDQYQPHYDFLAAQNQVGIRGLLEESHRATTLAAPSHPTPAARAIMDDLTTFIDNVVQDMTQFNQKYEFQAMYNAGLNYLSECDQRRFLLENMLEALKRGESLNQIVNNYRELGLTTMPFPEPPPLAPGVFDPQRAGLGEVCAKALRCLKAVGVGITGIVSNALAGIQLKGAVKIIVGAPMGIAFEFGTEASVERTQAFEILRKSFNEIA